MCWDEIDAYADLIFLDSIIPSAEEIREVWQKFISYACIHIFDDAQCFWEYALELSISVLIIFFISVEKCFYIVSDTICHFYRGISWGIDPYIYLIFICFWEHSRLKNPEHDRSEYDDEE